MIECKNCKCGILEGEYCVHCAAIVAPRAASQSEPIKETKVAVVKRKVNKVAAKVKKVASKVKKLRKSK